MRRENVRQIMAGFKLAVVFGGLAFAVAGCSEATRGRGVTPPPDELRVEKPIPPLDSIKMSIRNLTFDKEARTLQAAANLEKKGAEAVIAVPYLKEYSTMETNSDGFPSDRQREVFKKALEFIESDAKSKGVTIPTEKADISVKFEKLRLEGTPAVDPNAKKADEAPKEEKKER
jgi:hypothetical protein